MSLTPPEAKPSVSVVIATRNRPELLRRAVDAVLDQDYDGYIECLIVFDQAPVDDSLARYDEDKQRCVSVLPNSRTPGLAGARNSGINAAMGELIAFCDDDDMWLPDKLGLQVAELARSGAQVVVSGIEVNYRDKIVPRVPKPGDLSAAQLARRRVMEAHPSTVVVSSVALHERIGMVDEEIPGSYGEDFDWLLRAAQTGRIAVVQRPLVRVLWGTQSYFNQRWQTIIDAIDYGLAKHSILSADRRGHARLLGRKAFAYAALRETRPALHWARATLRLNWRERRAYVAIIVAVRLISAERALRLAHSVGRGI